MTGKKKLIIFSISLYFIITILLLIFPNITNRIVGFILGLFLFFDYRMYCSLVNQNDINNNIDKDIKILSSNQKVLQLNLLKLKIAYEKNKKDNYIREKNEKRIQDTRTFRSH